MSGAPMNTPIISTPTPLWQRCPVCGGRGTVPKDFYTRLGSGRDTQPVKCKSCDGKGVLR